MVFVYANVVFRASDDKFVCQVYNSGWLRGEFEATRVGLPTDLGMLLGWLGADFGFGAVPAPAFGPAPGPGPAQPLSLSTQPEKP